MKKLLVFAVLTAMATFLWLVHASESKAPQDRSITMDLEEVQIIEILRGLTLDSHVHLLYNPSDFANTNRVTVKFKDKPWRAALQSILAPQGFVVVDDPDGYDSYSVVRADKPETAVHMQYASAAVALADAVMADIKSNNIGAATARLQAFADRNRQTIKTLEAVQKGSQREPANRPSKRTR